MPARKIKINSIKLTKDEKLMIIFNNGTLWFPQDVLNSSNDTDIAKITHAINLQNTIQATKEKLLLI